jgi:hypothetical protein
LEFLGFLLKVRLVIRQGADYAGHGETDGAQQCRKRNSESIHVAPHKDCR